MIDTPKHVIAYLKSTVDGANVHETPNGKVIDAVGPLQKLHVGREEKTRTTVWTHVYYDRNGGPQQSGWIARKLLTYREVPDPDLMKWEDEGGAVVKNGEEFKGSGDKLGAVLAALVSGGILIAVILRSLGVI